MASESSSAALAADSIRRDAALMAKMQDAKSLTEAEMAEVPGLVARITSRKADELRGQMMLDLAKARSSELSEEKLVELSNRLEAKSRDENLEPLGSPVIAHYYGICRSIVVMMKALWKPVQEALPKDEKGMIAAQGYKSMLSYMDEVTNSVKREDKTMCCRTTKQHISKYIRDKVVRSRNCVECLIVEPPFSVRLLFRRLLGKRWRMYCTLKLAVPSAMYLAWVSMKAIMHHVIRMTMQCIIR
jgi:hypothetical protein